MDKTSTQRTKSMTKTQKTRLCERSQGPKAKTLAFLSQFARAYFPASVPGAIILN